MGTAYISQHQAKTAREYLTEALQIAEKLADVNFKRQVLNKIGDAFAEERKFATAINYYQQGLNIAQELNNRNGEGYALFKLGDAYFNLRQFLEARKYYQEDYYQLALSIKIEYGDRYSQALTYHCLGTLAEAQEDYTEARTNLQTALEIYVESKDEYWGNITREILERLPE